MPISLPIRRHGGCLPPSSNERVATCRLLEFAFLGKVMASWTPSLRSSRSSLAVVPMPVSSPQAAAAQPSVPPLQSLVGSAPPAQPTHSRTLRNLRRHLAIASRLPCNGTPHCMVVPSTKTNLRLEIAKPAVQAIESHPNTSCQGRHSVQRLRHSRQSHPIRTTLSRSLRDKNATVDMTIGTLASFENVLSATLAASGPCCLLKVHLLCVPL